MSCGLKNKGDFIPPPTCSFVLNYIMFYRAIGNTARVIPYTGALRSLAGQVTSTILLQQLEYWFVRYPDGFSKYLEPCKKNIPGNSWTEELYFSAEEFITAFEGIGVRYKSKSEYKKANKSGDPFNGKLYLSIYDRLNHTTFYLRNHEVADRRIAEAMNELPDFLKKPETLDSQGNREARFQETGDPGFGTPEIPVSINKELEIINKKTKEREEYPPISPQWGALSLEAGVEFESSGEGEPPADSPEPEVVATPNSEDSREVPKPESTSQQERSSPDGTNFPGVEQLGNSIYTQDDELPDHAIAHPAMLSPVQKTEDRFHRDRNYLLKLEKFAAVWNKNKPDDWLVVTLDRGAFKTQLTTAMKRYEGTVEELEKELIEAIAYAKTTKEAQKPLTALDLCNYSFSKLAEWSAKWKARHQPKESAHPISSTIDSLDDNWMDEIQKIYEENR